MALALCVSFTVPVTAEEPEAQLIYHPDRYVSITNFLPSITIEVPGAPGLQATFTNVGDHYYVSNEPYGYKFYYFFFNQGTVTFNQDFDFAVVIENTWYHITLPVSETYAITDGGLANDRHYMDYPMNENGYFFRPYEEGVSLEGKSAFAIIESLPISSIAIENEIPDSVSPTLQTVATPTASTVFVNGEDTPFDAYLINGNNYFKLRDLAFVLSGTEKQFNVGWDGEADAISLTSGEAYEPVGGEMEASTVTGDRTAIPTTSAIYLDGELVEFAAYTIGDNNYFKLRDIMQAFDVFVGWDEETSTIALDTSESYTD